MSDRDDPAPGKARRTIGAALLGLGVALSATGPARDWTAMASDHLWLAPVTPPFLLAVLAMWLARREPALGGDVPRTLIAGVGLLVLAALLSLVEAPDTGDALALAVLVLVAPAALFAAARRADLPLAALGWGFLAGTLVLCAVADLIWVSDHGLARPIVNDLLSQKAAGDTAMHRVLLGDAESSAAFALLPFIVTCWIASASEVPRMQRCGALAGALVSGVTVFLLFAATPIVIAAVVGAACLLRCPLSWRAKLGIMLATGATFVAAVLIPEARNYLNRFNDAVPEPLAPDAFRSGFDTLAEHPLTGGGFGTSSLQSVLAQAAGDLGVVGVVGIAAVASAIVAVAVRSWRGSSPLRAGLALVAGIYVLSSPGINPTWGLSLSLLLVAVLAPQRAPAEVPEKLRAVARDLFARQNLAPASLAIAERLPRYPSMVAFGLALGLAVAVYLNATLPDAVELIPTRADELRDVFAAHAQGKGPLVGLTADGFYPAGMADNPGLYWMLPGLADIFGWESSTSAFRGFFIGVLSLGAALLPSFAARLFGSVLAGVVVPLVALWCFRFVGVGDTYFFLVVAAGLGLPALLLIDRSWTRSRAVPPLAFIAVMLFASLAGLCRNGAGTPLLVVGMVVLWTNTSRKHRLPAIAISLLAFFAISHGLTRVVEAERRANLGHTAIAPSKVLLDATHFDSPGLKRRSIPFHLLYIGLGFRPNEYGIAYLDESAIDYALTVSPKAVYGTPFYNEVLRDRYMELLRTDPGFIASNVVGKAFVVLDDGISKFPLALLVIAAVFVARPRRSRERRWVGLLLLGGVSALLYPIAVMPVGRYQSAWFAALAWVFLLGVGWTCAALRPWLAQRRDEAWLRRPVDARRLRPPWLTPERRAALAASSPLTAWLAAAAVLVLILGVRVGSRSGDEALSIASSPTAAYSSPGAQPPVAEWFLAAGLPTDWTSVEAMLTPSATQLEVTTTAASGAYQLISPTVDLLPGTYIATARGNLRDGGMQVGVLNVSTNEWVETAEFAEERIVGQRIGFPVRFTVGETTAVQVILANYRPTAVSSHWALDDVTIRPATPQDTLAIAAEARRLQRSKQRG